ncbi:protein of unknown function [Micropruina glycogenica]|uniref:Uncharacterized protein n=1 Tax=Micropruina glycogenica TaxID=75385 RepID=A0A2N9JEX2_9ACTN|nr:protein of unknown function [Micropruina glycogenica]
MRSGFVTTRRESSLPTHRGMLSIYM